MADCDWLFFDLFYSNSEQRPQATENITLSASELNCNEIQTKDKMGGLRNRVICRLVSSTCFQMNRRKTLGEDVMDTPLRRCLSTLDITMLGWTVNHLPGCIVNRDLLT